MRALCAILLIGMILVPNDAYGVETCTEAQAVESPCAGVLLPPAEADSGLRCLSVELPRCDILRQVDAAVCKVQLDALDKVVLYEREHGEKLDDLLVNALKIEDTPLFGSGTASMLVGIVIGAALATTVALAVTKL